MPEIHDQKYGRIIVTRSRRSRYVRLSVTPRGGLQISAPLYTPLYFIKQFLKKSDAQVAELFSKVTVVYKAPMQIGKSHRLELVRTDNIETKVTYKKPVIFISLAGEDKLQDRHVQQMIQPIVAKALRLEAKAYLPRRLIFLSERMGYTYAKLRFSHAKSRWGSCSSEGVISLNIALMKLDFDLIDYVIIHELSHLKEMNHSPAFWKLVGQYSQNYQTYRKELKNQSPHI